MSSPMAVFSSDRHSMRSTCSVRRGSRELWPDGGFLGMLLFLLWAVGVEGSNVFDMPRVRGPDVAVGAADCIGLQFGVVMVGETHGLADRDDATVAFPAVVPDGENLVSLANGRAVLAFRSDGHGLLQSSSLQIGRASRRG